MCSSVNLFYNKVLINFFSFFLLNKKINENKFDRRYCFFTVYHFVPIPFLLFYCKFNKFMIRIGHWNMFYCCSVWLLISEGRSMINKHTHTHKIKLVLSSLFFVPRASDMTKYTFSAHNLISKFLLNPFVLANS